MATSAVTPDVSTPPPVSAGPATDASFSASVDSVFDRISSDAGSSDSAPPAADATPPEVVTADAPADELPPLDEPPADYEPPVAEAATPEAPEDVEHLAEITADKVEGGKYYTTKAKWDRLTAADKTVQQLRELDPAITVDAIKGMFTRTQALDEMLGHHLSGDPRRVASVASYFVGTGQDGRPNQSPQTVSAFADAVLANAARHYPGAFQTVERKMLATIAQKQYAKFQRSKNPDDGALAQNLDFMARGDFRRDLGQQQAAPADPLAAERAALNRERQTYHQRLQQDHQATVYHAVNAAESDAKAEVEKIIEAALSSIPTNVREKKPVEFKHAVRDLRESFEEATRTNANYTTARTNLLSQLRTNPTQEARSALVAFDQKWASWLIGKAKPEVVSRFSDVVMQQTQAANAKYEKLQERREPGGNSGSPVQRATLVQKLKEPTKDPKHFESKVDSFFEAVSHR